jgi:hypothetical protein
LSYRLAHRRARGHATAVFAEIAELIAWVLYGTGPRQGRKGRALVIALSLTIVFLVAVTVAVIVF